MVPSERDDATHELKSSSNDVFPEEMMQSDVRERNNDDDGTVQRARRSCIPRRQVEYSNSNGICDFAFKTHQTERFECSRTILLLLFSLLVRIALRLFVILYMYLRYRACLQYNLVTRGVYRVSMSIGSLRKPLLLVFYLLLSFAHHSLAYPNELDKTEQFLDKINLEQSIAAVFNKVAYGSTTKRSIPDNAYPVTTLATPLLTTYRYSDGNDEWLRVDVKNSESGRGGLDFEPEPAPGKSPESGGYGIDLEKDHALPTSAPAADILKNNNNKNYNNPNRYNNDRLRPDYKTGLPEQATENVFKTTTSYSVLKNVRPTKSMYSKDLPSYNPPSKVLFTPPLPPEFVNPFADRPTLRGTNSDGFSNRRPIPHPSLIPNKDRVPYPRPDLPPSKAVNVEKSPEKPTGTDSNIRNLTHENDAKNDRKKMLNTPSQNVRYGGEFYGVNRNVNESNFEYEKSYVPTITRILSGSNGRQDNIPDILLRTVTATPDVQKSEAKTSRTRTTSSSSAETSHKIQEENRKEVIRAEEKDTENGENLSSKTKKEVIQIEKVESKDVEGESKEQQDVATTQISDIVNLPNVKEKENNVTKASSDEIWLICWNVHVYLVVFGYILLAIYSIYKLIRYEDDPHMFSKSYFLTIHLMLTVICVLRIFYLAYDPYNFNKSFNIFLYDFLHNFPLSLLATTFAVLILFLLKRTLTHLEVKTRPVFLVVFGLIHILLCFCLSIVECLGHFDQAGAIVCKPIFILLSWALGFSYLYLYRIIKNVLAKKSQNLSEMCTQNISYASHITIAVALLFVLLGFVQLYAVFFIPVDKFNGEIKHHWILWGFELSVRFLEISIITLLAIVVSLKMSQREKQTVGFPLFPCTTSDSSTDNIYPNNCNTNPNAMNYSRNEMILDNIPTEAVERPNLLKNSFQNDSFDKKSTLERYQSDPEHPANFDRFERAKWGSGQFENRPAVEQTSLNNFSQPNSGHFERGQHNNGSRNERNSSRKMYESGKYYTKPKYDVEYNNDDFFTGGNEEHNVYSEPVDNNHYERTKHEFERSEFDRRPRNSSNTSGRRSTGRARKNHARPHLGVQTLPNHDARHQSDSMLVDDQGFVRFRHLQDELDKPKRLKKHNNDVAAHFSDA